MKRKMLIYITILSFKYFFFLVVRWEQVEILYEIKYTSQIGSKSKISKDIQAGLRQPAGAPPEVILCASLLARSARTA